jgi:hypothetical protein
MEEQHDIGPLMPHDKSLSMINTFANYEKLKAGCAA